MNDNRYNLTFPENNIYLVEKFNDRTAINTIAGLLKIESKFDEKICNKIINKLIESNDALRIKIYEENNSAYQVVEDYIYEDIEYIDMSNKTDKEIEKYMSDSVNIPFQFIDSKLYEFKVIRYNSNTGCIFMKLHHTISDAWTLMQIINQLLKNYNKVNENIDENIVVPSYTEYISSENEYLNSDKYLKDEEFWRNYLNGISNPVSIKETTSKVSTRAARYSVQLSKKENNKINEYCNANRVSPYTLFLGALSTYIYRIKDNNDFVIGTPILNRSNFREKQMLGMFVSTMPIRMKVEENVKFLDLVKQIGSDTMSLFRHQKYPITKTLEHIHDTTDIKEKIYNIMLSYQNARSDIEESSKLFSTKWLFSGYIQDDLEIHIMDMDNNGVLHINYDYLKDLFEKIEIKYLHTRLMSIVQNAIDDIDVNVDNINIMSKEDNRNLFKFNDTYRDYPKDITAVDLFEKQVEKNPDSIALVFEGKQMTYRELNEKANQLAWYLIKEKNVQANDVVGIILKRGFEMIISIIGIIKSGATYLSIDSEFPEDRINYMIENSNTKIIVTSNDSISENCENIDIYKIEESSINNPNVKIGMNDNFYVLYTSGSTGNPKGTIIKHSNISNFMYHFLNNKIYNNCKTIVSVTTISFDIFTFETISSLINGLKIVIANEEEQKIPKLLNNLINKENIEIIQTTPTRMQLLLDNIEDFDNIKKLKRIVLAGEQLQKQLINKITKLGDIEIYNGYGPTETTIFSSFTDVTKSKRVSIGKPFSNTKFYILDKKRRILPIGIEGELYIGGKGVSNGYLNMPELNKSAFLNIYNQKFYKCGDICKIGFDYNTYCYGRIDNQVKLRGLRIELDEISTKMNCFAGISNSVGDVYRDKNEDFIVVYYTQKYDFDIMSLKKYMLRKLPKYMIPRYYIKLLEIPVTPNGKIDRKQLSKFYLDDKSINKNNRSIYVNTKKTLIQTKLCNIYEKNLNINNLNVNDDLFELGIDSLNAIKISISISNDINVDINVKDVLESQTILQLEEKVLGLKLVSNNRIIPCKQEKYPLTSSQKGIFSNYMINVESTIYNIPFEIKLSKNVNIEKLYSSIRQAILNHPSLFYKLYITEDNIYTKPDKLEFDFKFIKLHSSQYIKVKEKFLKSFDLLKDRLFRVDGYITEKNIFILFDFHHIIFDGYSINILLNDINNAYNGLLLQEEEIEFGQFALLDDQQKKSKKYSKAREYFTNKLNDELPVVSLSNDYPRNNIKGFKGNKINKILNNELKEKLIKYVKENNITLNNLFLAMFNFVISKYTYNEDIIIGIASSGREYKHELNTIGMFVKTLPYRIKIDLDKSFLEYLNETQNLMLEVIENECYNFEDIVRDLKIKRDISRNPIFDIMYVFQNTGKPEIYLDNEKLEINQIKSNTSKFDLTFEVLPNEKQIDLNLEYDTGLFEQDTIEIFADRIINGLEYITTNKMANLKDIEIISKEEENLIVNDFNNTKTDYPKDKTIHQLFEKQVEINPNKVAIVFEDKNLTYKQLNEKSNQLANYISSVGIGKSDVVAIMLDKSLEMIIGILAILKVGGVYLPIDVTFPYERKKVMIDQAGAKLLLIDDSIDNESKKILKNINISLNESYDRFSNKANNNENVSVIDDLAYIMYTSGTTGKPKGVAISHDNVLRLILNTNYIKPQKNDRVLQTGAIGFDATTFEFWYTLFNGLTIYIIPKEKLLDVVQFKEYMIKNEINVLFLTSQLFKEIVQYDPTTFKNVRVLLTGGEVLSIKHINSVFETCKNTLLYNVYGPTEGTTFSTYYRILKRYNNYIPIGKPISNTTCYIVDKCNQLAGTKMLGELYIGGDGVSKGYYNNIELTKEKFIDVKYNNDRVYKTGDLVKWLSDGSIYFNSRVDDQIKIRGFRIELDEIRTAIEEYSNINDSFVVVKKINGTNKIFAYYMSDNDIDPELVKNYLKKKIPIYMVPEALLQVNKIEMNVNGKVDKSKLPDIINNKIINENELPATELHKTLYEIWTELLLRNDIGINDNFFEIGGDSLLATQMVVKLLSKDIHIKYGDIFTYNTIKDIAEHINNNESKLESDISLYDYSKCNDLIINQDVYNSKVKRKNNIKNILLTGATGFLGAHVLYSYIRNTKYNVYCLVRKKNGKLPIDNLREKIEFFFGKRMLSLIGKRIFVVDGDITHDDLFYNNEDDISNRIDAVVHTAAVVKHYGNIEMFEKININGTKNIVKYCKKNNKKLYHISTLSVSGNVSEGSNEQQSINEITYFDEKNFYIGQNISNAYVKTKFIAEKIVFDAILDGLEAKIIRVGNLTGRYTDGKFQPNVEENAFSNRIKSMLYLKVIPENISNFYVEFTPIDYCADVIVKVINSSTKQVVIHAFNHKHVSIESFTAVLKHMGFKIDIVSNEIFSKKIKEIASYDSNSESIIGIAGDLDKDTQLNYLSNIIVKSDISQQLFKQLGFKWPIISKKYIKMYIEYLCNIGFIKKNK